MVYFNDTHSAVVKKEDLEIPVWQKEGAENFNVPICYCFGHSEASIRGEIAEKGSSNAFKNIKAHVQAGRCACEIKNPQGSCCLENVSQVVRRILGKK